MTLITKLIQRFKASFEYRHTYMESFADSFIATQIKVLREHLHLSQTALAERAGMRQSQISALEDVNNSTWKISTLKKIARAFDLVLVVRFEEFGSVLPDVDRFERSNLDRSPFADDPIFSDTPLTQAGTASTKPQDVRVAAVATRVLTFRPRMSMIMTTESTSSGHFTREQAAAR